MVSIFVSMQKMLQELNELYCKLSMLFNIFVIMLKY